MTPRVLHRVAGATSAPGKTPHWTNTAARAHETLMAAGNTRAGSSRALSGVCARLRPQRRDQQGRGGRGSAVSAQDRRGPLPDPARGFPVTSGFTQQRRPRAHIAGGGHGLSAETRPLFRLGCSARGDAALHLGNPSARGGSVTGREASAANTDTSVWRLDFILVKRRGFLYRDIGERIGMLGNGQMLNKLPL